MQYARGRDTPPSLACAEVGECGQVWLSGLPDTGPRLITLFPSHPRGGLSAVGLVRMRTRLSFGEARGQAKVEANFKHSSTAKAASSLSTTDKNIFYLSNKAYG